MDKRIEKYEKLLLEIPGVTSAKWVKTMDSSFTTSWGGPEGWSEDYIARDILQNFYDQKNISNLGIDSIKISTKDDKIIVTSPCTFDLRKLFFLGSSKSELENQLGKFGEGAKFCYASLAKKQIFDPINISGKQAVIVGVGPEVKGTDLRPFQYFWFSINEQKGSSFAISTYSKKLKEAFNFGMNHFWDKDNKLVGAHLHSYNDISVYESKSKTNGYIFYNNLNRGIIKNIPVIINISKKYKIIEDKVKNDRDRSSFTDKLESNFYSIFIRSGFHYGSYAGNKALHYILKKSKKIWSEGKGHPLISAIANGAYDRLKKDNAITSLFDKKLFFSESNSRFAGCGWNDWYDHNVQRKILQKDLKFKKQGYIKLPSYFSRFGVKSSLDIILRNKELLEQRIKNSKTGKLSIKQRDCVNFCFEALKELSPSFSSLYKEHIEDEDGVYYIDFKQVTSKDILGQLKSERSYDNKTVYLEKDLFKSSFGRFFSVFCHELLHIFGHDGQRTFSDTLTNLLASAVDKNSQLSNLSKKWSNLTA